MELLKLLMTLIFLAIPIHGMNANTLQEANASLLQGEKATRFEERKEALNHALYLYLQVAGASPSPFLFRVIGDCYFQLGEYAWATLYYEKSLVLDGQDTLAVVHLEQAQKKLGISSGNDKNRFDHRLSELARQKSVLYAGFVIAFLSLSLSVWQSRPFFRKIAFSCSFLFFLLLVNFAGFYYSSPLEGIVVTPTGFYRGPNEAEPQLSSIPLFAGSKVNLLQMTPDGKWLKIENGPGMIGYIPTLSVRII